MSIFSKLFGNKQRGEKGLEAHLDYLDSLRKPTLLISKTDSPGFSKIGGLPSVPQGFQWPQWNGKPLSFLCQIDLSEASRAYSEGGLPASGYLYFFYDGEQQTWGFDPKDRGSWQVYYTPDDGKNFGKSEAPQGLLKDYIYKEKFIEFSLVRTYPDWQDERVERLQLTDKQSDDYFDLHASVFAGQPSHQLLGYPSTIQDNDMDLECQLASNDLYCGDASGYNDKRRNELEKGRGEWLLLLQLDSDDDTGMMWGDCGMLYFWIKKQDLREKRFNDCWMILQCS